MKLRFLILTLLLFPSAARSMCCPIGLPSGQIVSSRQINLVVMERDVQRITLIPNITLRGDSEKFSLIVPTPTQPSFAEVDQDVWADLGILTAPTRRRDSGGGLDCGTQFDADVATETTSGIHIVSVESIGSFEATVIDANGDPDGLIVWLATNGFVLSPDAASRFAPYVDRGWFFTAMKLNEDIEMPPNGWNVQVDPVAISYDAEELEVPLPLLEINAEPWLSMWFVVVDDYRVTLSGFRTSYANAITDAESGAITARHPSLAPYIRADRYVTALAGGISAAGSTGSMFLRRADTQDEHRDGLGWAATAAPVGDLTLLASPFAIPAARAWLRRRRRRGAAMAEPGARA